MPWSVKNLRLPPRQRGKLAWAVLACGTATLLMLLVIWPRAQASSTGERTRAQERWSVRPFDGYRLVVQEQIGNRICQQDVEIKGEQIAKELGNSCGRPSLWTTTRIFDYITQLETPEGKCWPSDSFCACNVVEETRAIYDSSLGYPRSVTYTWRLWPNLTDPSYWRYAWQMHTLKSCEQHGGQVIQLDILSLAPMP